ncbi:EXT2 (predicted) [Pycnogonum litorale]
MEVIRSHLSCMQKTMDRLKHFMSTRHYKSFCIFGSSAAVFVTVLLTSVTFLWPHNYNLSSRDAVLTSLFSPEDYVLDSVDASANNNSTCDYYTCFNVNLCGKGIGEKILVYVYPHRRIVDTDRVSVTYPASKEFYEIIRTIINSDYHTDDPVKACLFVPAIDTLNQNRLRLEKVSRALAVLPYWRDGENHLLFNMLPGSAPDYNTTLDLLRGKALIAGSGFSTHTYRHGYDISIPTFNPITYHRIENYESLRSTTRRWLLISSQYNVHDDYIPSLQELREKNPRYFLLLTSCTSSPQSHNKKNISAVDQASNSFKRCNLKGDAYKYPEVLQDGTFCLVARGARLAQPVLLDAMMSGCIPVIVADELVLPFSEVLDWKRASVRLYEEQLINVIDILKSISSARVETMRHQLSFLLNSYLSSVPKITLTTLKILNDRVFPHAVDSYSDWNDPPSRRDMPNKLSLPPFRGIEDDGFTAVILMYDRLQSLYEVIERISLVPSLSKIIVVWNNQRKSPPPLSKWPKIGRPLKVIRTKENKLSNRFYPYDEIKTEAILSIDDDIVMLTVDEIEFAYQVWKEFPDRIVGFPSRLHIWDNSSQDWKYESQWTNEISLVLTGVAFYHKIYNYLYTTSMPGNIKEWVDEKMNCEDIAMNFLVSNITDKAPIKVAPRKKFKCSECSSGGILSADISHMVERSECINKFVNDYGKMPLKLVEFRADPVLFKDDLPSKLKLFNDIGKL